ncbi:MAG TPA: DUF4920 domain-containing protein [Solibacterales bacterium]|nr:DUF4920 domain-containing protein [Bryobacterales bacterium]
MRTFALLLLVCFASFAADTKLGQPLTLDKPVTVAELMAAPDAHLGKTVQVKGKVTEVCQNMGCWMNLVDSASGKSVRIKVKDGEIVFPKDSVGKMAVAEGKLAKMELTKQQVIDRAKHEAEEQGRKFDPATVKSGATVYQINGTGAVLMAH